MSWHPFFFKINTWSFTKHRVWNRCQRQYDYDYIAPFIKSNSLVPPEKIRWLKNFTSKFVIQGQIIHDIIDQQIQRYCENKPMNPDIALKDFVKKVSLYKKIGGETFSECHNGEKISDSFFSYVEENGKICLQTFFNKWPIYENRTCLRHEQYDHFYIEDMSVTVKVDYIGKMPDSTLILTDWKTGRDDDEYETELQMASYVIWAKEYYKRSADKIKTELVFLKSGTIKPYAFIEDQLIEIQDKIHREFAAMNASYNYRDFPPNPSQRECLSCKFAEVCSEKSISTSVRTRKQYVLNLYIIQLYSILLLICMDSQELVNVAYKKFKQSVYFEQLNLFQNKQLADFECSPNFKENLKKLASIVDTIRMYFTD